MSRSALRPHLIEVMKQYPNLYNTGHADYKDLEQRDKSWLEISQAMNENCELVKREWKILRDSFRQAVNRRRVAKKGSRPKRWRFEKQMSYLLPYMTHKLADGFKQQYVDPLPDEAYSNPDSEESVEQIMDDDVKMEDPVKLEDKTYWSQNTIPASSFTSYGQAVQPTDDLDMFFKSLQCTARKLPRNYQNRIKKELLEVVSKAEEEYFAEEQNIL